LQNFGCADQAWWYASMLRHDTLQYTMTFSNEGTSCCPLHNYLLNAIIRLWNASIAANHIGEVLALATPSHLLFPQHLHHGK